ncbi:MAG: putative peptide zinc metalloprotease protein [Actinomycetota bacterium]|nr:putative peptide zinc metalloprotease protein [Actinomycetota bacterium]
MSITSSSPEAGSRASGDEGAVPVRADGVELLGELPGSGYRKPPALVRRGDGQTIQLTRLLYLVLEAVDGKRDHDAVAATVSESMDRLVSGEQVRELIATKLLPLGVLRLADGSQPEVKKANPLLALKLRYVVSDPEKTRRLTAPFAALFQPVIVTLLTLVFLATAGWVLFQKGLGAATHDAFHQPGLLLALFAVTIVSAGFHEFGHAAACRYGGATPGAMGAGLYLVWPAFYTEVTDSYRLGRAGRVRVDLGGLYFNAIFAVGSFALWAVTRWDAVLLLIAAQVLQMLRQLAPFVRFDGYHILADLTGVPDLYHHIKPTLLGLLPQNWRRTESHALKRWARVVVTVWVLVVVPLLALSLLMMVIALPRVLATGWESLGNQWNLLGTAWDEGDIAGVGVRALSVAAIALPLLATVYLVVRVVRRTAAGVWRKTEGKPVRRAIALVLAAALVAGLAFAWWPRDDTYRPIQADERGTVLDGLPIAQNRPILREGQVGATRTVLGSGATLGTKDKPQLALVLVPKEGSDAPTWVFPFNKPAPPGEGGNQALAVNTKDGSTLYEVAFALVWAEGSSVLNRNEAYAFASCKACKTVAVGFQVVLIVGQANVIVPQNLSAAANYACIVCVTYAIAKQIIISLPKGLSPAAMARLNTLWAQIQQFGQRILRDKLPVGQIYAGLAGYETQIMDIVQADRALARQPDTSTVAPSVSPEAPVAPVEPSPGTVATAEVSPEAAGGSAAPGTEPSGAGSTGPVTSEPAVTPPAPVDSGAPAPATTTTTTPVAPPG